MKKVLFAIFVMSFSLCKTGEVQASEQAENVVQSDSPCQILLCELGKLYADGKNTCFSDGMNRERYVYAECKEKAELKRIKDQISTKIPPFEPYSDIFSVNRGDIDDLFANEYDWRNLTNVRHLGVFHFRGAVCLLHQKIPTDISFGVKLPTITRFKTMKYRVEKVPFKSDSIKATPSSISPSYRLSKKGGAARKALLCELGKALDGKQQCLTEGLNRERFAYVSCGGKEALDQIVQRIRPKEYVESKETPYAYFPVFALNRGRVLDIFIVEYGRDNLSHKNNDYASWGKIYQNEDQFCELQILATPNASALINKKEREEYSKYTPKLPQLHK